MMKYMLWWQFNKTDANGQDADLFGYGKTTFTQIVEGGYIRPTFVQLAPLNHTVPKLELAVCAYDLAWHDSVLYLDNNTLMHITVQPDWKDRKQTRDIGKTRYVFQWSIREAYDE